MYNKTLMDHFQNPRNLGSIKSPDGIGEVGNPTCGDIMKIYIKVDKNRLTDIKFETLGCGAAIGTSSMVTELAKGKTLSEALKISNQDVAKNLGGLPIVKMHCSNLAADALHVAIKNYQNKQAGKKGSTKKIIPPCCKKCKKNK
ncbi:MAG: Fe-S cluster assembly scaffold protein NifU [Patescibacteria group bacterium]